MNHPNFIGFDFFSWMLFQPNEIYNVTSGVGQMTGSENLINAGGKFFTRQHIINAQNQAQKLNPNV